MNAGSTHRSGGFRLRRSAVTAALLGVLLSACEPAASDRLQGYVEGRYVYVSSPLGGTLETLHVERGATIDAGAPLFVLESGAERSERAEAEQRLLEARAQLADLEKGARDSEIAAREAMLREAHAALVFTEAELKRQQDLFATADATPRDVEQARALRDVDVERVRAAEADLATARLPARSDAIAAAASRIDALDAAVERANWDLAQKVKAATCAGRVFDTYYRVGEYVPAGRPVVALLPPDEIEVRTFVPQERLAALQIGERAQVSADGRAAAVGRVTFVSPNAEYTPPVIYSKESRAKLVYMVVISFEPEIARTFHPGQPVDVRLGVAP